ncbi:solute carrier family 22 member [Plakobranchus ocellatus]|uniref:Solute carrier family 22 member n=1 Tax=Plakobranchus ocellatus TaxID=259542 RepID=A0AAV3YDA7_9GAST|nr:solute carrier family 22 member [Plakobranchus ocellatus]
MDVDKIQQQLSSKWRFQILAYFCLGLIYTRGAWNVFGVIYLAADTGHHCSTNTESTVVKSCQQVKESTTFKSNSTGNGSISSFQKGESAVVGKECDIVMCMENGTNITKPCDSGWVYGDEFESTIVSEWDLVCVRAYLNELSTTLFMAGSMMGALFITPLSDSYGRRLVLLICLLAQAVIGSCVAFSPTYAVFTILRFIVGFFNMGIALCTYVLMTELFPGQYRTIPCCGFQIFWALGIMVTALFGYLIRDWHDLQLVFCLPNVLFAGLVWFLPESLPWLISQKKFALAQDVVNKIARINSLDIPEDLIMQETMHLERSENDETCAGAQIGDRYVDQPLLSGALTHKQAVVLLSEATSDDQDFSTETPTQSLEQKNEGVDSMAKVDTYVHQDVASNASPEVQVVDKATPVEKILQLQPERLKNVFVLCKTPRMRLYSFILFFLFFVNSLAYFGISLSTPVMHGNQFFNLFLLGVVEIPAYIICVVVCQRVGRKVPLWVFLLLCGIVNITAMFISKKASVGMNAVRLTFVMMGKFAITGAYTTVYLYSAEIFPTSIRNHGMGVSSFFENFGSISAPFIVFAAKSIPELPLILFGMISIIGGVMATALPETHQRPLPQTVEEVESWDMYRRRRTT